MEKASEMKDEADVASLACDKKATEAKMDRDIFDAKEGARKTVKDMRDKAKKDATGIEEDAQAHEDYANKYMKDAEEAIDVNVLKSRKVAKQKILEAQDEAATMMDQAEEKIDVNARRAVQVGANSIHQLVAKADRDTKSAESQAQQDIQHLEEVSAEKVLEATKEEEGKVAKFKEETDEKLRLAAEKAERAEGYKVAKKDAADKAEAATKAQELLLSLR